MKVVLFPILLLFVLIVSIIFIEIRSYIIAKKHLEKFRIIKSGLVDKGLETSVFRIKRMLIAFLTVISTAALVINNRS